MPRHYGLKAKPIEIVADPTAWGLAKRALRGAWETIRWNVARLLRLRWR
jgi:hypothetical protein